MIESNGQILSTGWIDDAAAVAESCRVMSFAGHELDLTKAAPRLFEEDADDRSVFLWEAEQHILGRLLPCWNQNPVGSCVGFGFTRGAQDVLLNEIAAGEPEIWPGAELAPEVTYIGSRVEVNDGRCPIRPTRRDPHGDGSVGAWAVQFLTEWGLVKRGVYGSIDLTRYDPAWVRDNQFRGVPDEIETVARLHPIQTAAKMTGLASVWAALGARKAVPFCSIMGFSMSSDRDGFCVPSGQWGHCWLWRGRFIHPRRGKCVIAQNSWRNDDGSVTFPTNGPITIDTVDRGPVALPEGCVAMGGDIVEAMCREGDTFALAGVTGWKKLRLTWEPLG